MAATILDEHREKVARLCLEWDRTDSKSAGDAGFLLACAVTSLLYGLGLVRGGRLTEQGRLLASEGRQALDGVAASFKDMELRVAARQAAGAAREAADLDRKKAGLA